MFIDHPLVQKDKLRLRRYQEAAIARATDDSTLVVLPTGLGKTIIAAMVAAHRLHTFAQSKVLFLAPTKPLVLQHMKTFGELLSLDGMCVLTGHDPPEKRKSLWAQNRAVFATPQTIENDIIRGLDLRDVSLIIFDEAHRAVGDYSYVSIAREYLKRGENQMTLGLTASPSSQEATVREICSNLGIRQVEAKTDLDADVKPYIQQVKIRWVKVDLPEEFRSIQRLLQDVMREDLKKLKQLDYIHSFELAKVNMRHLLEAQAKIRADITNGVEAFVAASVVASAIKINHAIELLETQGIGALDEYFSRVRSQGSKAVKALMENHAMLAAMSKTQELRKAGLEHPKLDELVRIVSKYKGRKVLVFTQYRDSVDAIIGRLNASDILAHEFIGQAKKGLKDGMSQRAQVDVLERFKLGDYTALVATSVAEEGLDIPRVDAVVFFEPVPSEIRTIQRRGRTGRSATGEVYVLLAKGTRDEVYYWASYHKEQKMGRIVRQMRSGKKQQSIVDTQEYVEADSSKVQAYDVEPPKPPQLSGQQSICLWGNDAKQRLKIIADTRERSNIILSALREGCDIELRQLPVGDFLLSDRVCVERKTMDDFLTSIVDHRLMSQLVEMKRNFEAPILILENVDRLYAQRNIHPNAIRGVLASISVDYRIPIIPSEDEEDTAAILLAIAKREQLENTRVVALRGEKKPELLSEKQRFVVESLPQVSSVLADRLLKRFKTLESLMNANEETLREVDGIGAKKAQEIRNVIKTPYIR
jgi:Fanconi anemia group M protein